MFEDARRKMEAEMRRNSSNSSSSSSSSKRCNSNNTSAWRSDLTTEREYDFQAETEINQQAKRQTMEYLSCNQSLLNCQETKTKTMLVYKFLATPEHWLTQGMKKMDSSSLKSYYKNLALHLHPDKNSHPQAKEAFQKISNVFRNTQKA
jgi:hypothetical protein